MGSSRHRNAVSIHLPSQSRAQSEIDDFLDCQLCLLLTLNSHSHKEFNYRLLSSIAKLSRGFDGVCMV